MELAEFLQTIKTDPKNGEPETHRGEKSFRSLIEELLTDGPKPYEEILDAAGGDEDALREAIRGWDELVSTTIGEMTLWEIRSARPGAVQA